MLRALRGTSHCRSGKIRGREAFTARTLPKCMAAAEAGRVPHDRLALRCASWVSSFAWAATVGSTLVGEIHETTGAGVLHLSGPCGDALAQPRARAERRRRDGYEKRYAEARNRTGYGLADSAGADRNGLAGHHDHDAAAHATRLRHRL